MTIFLDQLGYNILDLGFDKSLTKILVEQQGSVEVTPEMINVFSQGTSPRSLISGELISSLEQQAGVIFSGKTAFSNSETGYRLGIENSTAKFYIGDSSHYLNWTGSDLDISGLVSAGSIDIGGSDATSFHVDVDGNIWSGAATYASAPFKVSNAGALTATSATVSGYILTGVGAFGGTGADGALSIISGTTTLDLGGATLFEKNYTSISITGTGKLAFSNPHANGTVIILRSQGDVTLTSSTVPCIDVSEMGASGATAGTSGGGNGSAGNMIYYHINGATSIAGNGSTGSITGSTTGATAVAALANPRLYIYDLNSIISLHASTRFLMACGSGGGSSGGATSIAGAAGGKGGGALLIECYGALNVTGTLWSKGGVGGTGSGSTASTGGGGGGSGGTIAIFYNTLTANSGTYTVSGGNGGNGGATGATNKGATGGGAGGSSVYYIGGSGGGGENAATSGSAAGGAGGSGSNGSDGSAPAGGGASSAGGGGGGGASGQSLVIQNRWIS